MADLKTDYKDDILDTSQNTRRKYQMVDNGDGTVSFVDVTEYIQQGDSFGADDTNATNTKVNALESDIDEINDKLTCESYEATGGITIANAISNWIAQANMSVGETRRVDIEFSGASGHPHYIIEITKTKNYNNEDVYTGWAMGNTDVTNRRNFLTIGNTTTIQVINSYQGALASVSSSSGKTFKQALQELYTVWSLLSSTEKRCSMLLYGNTAMVPANTGNGYYTTTLIDSTGKIVVDYFGLQTGTARRVTGTTYSDITNTTLDNSLALYGYNTQSYTRS